MYTMTESYINCIEDGNLDIIWSTKEKMDNKTVDNDEKKKNRIIGIIKKPFISGIIASVIASAIWTCIQSIYYLPNAIMKTAESDEYIDKLRTAIISAENITNSGNITNENNNNSSNQSTNASNVNVYNNIYLDKNSITDALSDAIKDAVSVEDNDISKSEATLKSNDIVAKDINGKEYYASDLVGKQIELEYYYKNDNRNVWFQGMYNENYHWEGECVTNSYYVNGKFSGACESTFEDGVRINYKSIVGKNNEWDYSDKVCYEDGNDGVNIEYEGNANVEVAAGDSSNPRIYMVDSIRNEILPYLRMTSFYKGKTIGEKYNDDTGLAYLIQFNSEGMVTLLYQGPFCKGYGNTSDSEHTGWEIAYNHNRYYYNEGAFVNGHFANDSSGNPVSISEIKQYISEKNFDADVNLAWIA